jgi:hypothetical protein
VTETLEDKLAKIEHAADPIPRLCEGDEGSYPADDIKAVLGPDGKWQFTHKDGRKY